MLELDSLASMSRSLLKRFQTILIFLLMCFAIAEYFLVQLISDSDKDSKNAYNTKALIKNDGEGKSYYTYKENEHWTRAYGDNPLQGNNHPYQSSKCKFEFGIYHYIIF